MIVDLDRWLADENEREAEGRVFPEVKNGQADLFSLDGGVVWIRGSA